MSIDVGVPFLTRCFDNEIYFYYCNLSRYPVQPRIRGRHPVIHITWYDAIEYCNWLSLKLGKVPVYAIENGLRDPNNLSREDQNSKRWKVTCTWLAQLQRRMARQTAAFSLLLPRSSFSSAAR